MTDQPPSVDHPSTPVHLEDGANLEEFVTSHDIALVEFFTTGCTMCQAMEPVLGIVARATDVAVGTVNPGNDLELVERFSIRSVPMLVCFRDGNPVASKADGFQSTDEVIEFLESNTSKSIETR